MSTSILYTYILVFIKIIGYRSVCGNKVTLDCPPGYLVKATPTYDYEKTESNQNIKKFMVCVLCKPQSERNTNVLEICTDNGFTEAANTSSRWSNNGNDVLRYQASVGHRRVKKIQNNCDDENHETCHDEICSANFSLSTDEEGGLKVDSPTFNKCKKDIKATKVEGSQQV